jgi:HK97 family phage major capsid protein
MSDLIIKAVEDGIKSVETKLGAQLDSAIEKYEGQVSTYGKAQDEIRAEVKQLSAEFESAVTELAQKMQNRGVSAPEMSAGEEFTKSEQFKALVTGQVQRARLEVKNTVVSADTTVFPTQRPGVIRGDFAPLTIRELFTSIPVTSNMVNSLREASFVNSAAEVAQAAAKAESDATFEQYNVPITTVAHWIKVSNQLLADAPAIVAYIDTRARDGLAQRIDAQLLNGNGTSPNLSGLTDSGNFVAYTATVGDLLVDAINRAKWTLWATGNTPDTVIVNPADWGAMERTREGSGTGMYLYGAPGSNGMMNPFGLNIVISNNMTAGKFLVGAIANSTALYVRQGATVEMGYVNDDFTKNLVTIRVEERLGLGVERPSALLYGDFTAAP